MKSLQDVAKQLKNTQENIILVYAFNSTGKTRLSVAYKDLTKDPESGSHAGVYYNAFSEDLFVWDNDEGGDGSGVKLKIVSSSLNKFHGLLENDAVTNKLAMYRPAYSFRLNAYAKQDDDQDDKQEKGFESIYFFMEGAEKDLIKISRGEERIFVWCFFLAMLEVKGWADKQDQHIFIDDPVSSLDEHNIYITAETIVDQIKRNHLKKRIIITTHHIGLFSLLANRLKKGGESGGYEEKTKLYILNKKKDKNEEKFSLDSPKNNVFLYHLHLLQILEEARQGQLYTHHVVLLRQVLENVASFLGKPNFSYTLEQIGVEDIDNKADMINSLSHAGTYRQQSSLMPPDTQNVYEDILSRLLEKFKFAIHAKQS